MSVKNSNIQQIKAGRKRTLSWKGKNNNMKQIKANHPVTKVDTTGYWLGISQWISVNIKLIIIP